jgi:hypothetical protein
MHQVEYLSPQRAPSLMMVALVLASLMIRHLLEVHLNSHHSLQRFERR